MTNTKKEWYVEVLGKDGSWIKVTGIVTHAESSSALTEWIRRGSRARAIYVGDKNDRPAGLANLLRGKS